MNRGPCGLTTVRLLVREKPAEDWLDEPLAQKREAHLQVAAMGKRRNFEGFVLSCINENFLVVYQVVNCSLLDEVIF